ncbi:MAG: hypothetical protein MRZ66_03175, partial [Clostridiales bacterium]|nr:hypothetical protein [Clostridiales bacterium]
SGSDRKTAAQFKSGEVAYLLSQGGGNGGSVWGQKIGTDDYPVLNGDPVYATTGCVTYNNSGDTSEKGHNYEEGICTGCGAYTEPEKDENDVYQISKVTDLYWLADTVNSGNGSIDAVLINDITVNSDLLRSLKYDTDGNVTNDDGLTYWTPIGYYNSDSDCSLYTGTFDGQGHTISGLYFNDTNIDYVGLFGYVGTVTDGNGNVISAGEVLNVGVVDSYFSGDEDVGGVCGWNYGAIGNCYNTGTVSGNGCVGGVCGYNYYGTIENCYNTGTVSGDEDVGGVCGENDDGTVTNCYYLSKTSCSDRKTAAQFKSGEVAYLLSQGCGIWGQKIGTDDYSVLNGDTVYATTGCTTYNNEGDTHEKEHHYEEGICTDCGAYTEPEKDASGVYQISKVTDLYWLADTVNSGNNSVNAVLTNDITVNSDLLSSLEYDTDGSVTNEDGLTYWTPIGYYNSDSDCSLYTGTFDGQGHTISGLYFNDTNIDYVGLFGYVGEGGSVLNVGVVDSYFSGKNFVSGVCGENDFGTIENCYNEGTVSGKNYVGGVCGYNYNGTIENCYNTGTVSGKNYVGGVCGYNYNGTIENCYNEGTVSGSGYCVGGVCGETYYGTIENCYNTGTVSGIYYVGGVCGENYDSTITGCYNEGTVSGSGNIGGVCGGNSSSGKITNCYNEGTVSGIYYVGGVCGGNYGTIENCYNTGSVSGGEGVGGVCGQNGGIGKITNCYSTGTVSGSGNVGGVCGYNSAGTNTNSYNEGTVRGSSNDGGVCGLNYSTIENCYNTGSVSGGEVVGGVCGNNNGSGTITNCYSTGVVSGSYNIGGVCGYNSSSSTITNCYYLKTDTINKDTNAIGNEVDETLGKAESKATTDYTDGTVCGLVKYHSHQNGICILCDGYEPAIKTTDKYDINNDGTKDTVYEISSAGQLYWFADKVNNENETYGNANAVLTANITVNSNLLGSLQYDDTDGSVTNGDDFTDWTPIGWYDDDRLKEYFYTGIFDGQGHTIIGLYFNDKNSYNVGLFGYVGKNGSVYNVGVVDSYFSGSYYVGGVCGDNYGIITNCYSTGAISGSGNVGGVCGENKDGTITNCYNTATVSGGGEYSYYVGGVCGENEGGTITNCYNTGTVSGSNEFGGVCGENEGGTIKNCYYLEGTASSGIGNADSDSVGKAESKTTEKFAGGEVAYILQSAQTADTEGDPIPQVWGQTLTGKIKDASPVLASGSAKKVYKVTFATQSNPTYAVKYANPSGVYELPTAPETDNSNYGFYKWSTSQTDYSNAANDFTATTAVTGDITVYAVSSEKYGENDNEKTITTTYGTGATQDLSEYAVFATGATSAGKFTYTIESGNDVLGATIDNDTLTIPSTAPAGTYTLTIKATEKEPVISLMSDELGTEPFMFDVTITVNPLAENTPAISVNYTDETLTGFESGNYTIDGTDVTPTDGALEVESYIGSEISIVKKASDTNHADSAAQTLEIPSRPTAPTGSDFTVTQPILVGETGIIAGITSAMEYSTNGGTTWSDGGSTVTNIPGGTTYQVRYKATASSFKSDYYVIVIGEGTAEEITPIGKYSGSVKIRKEVAGDKAVFTITPVSGNADEVSSVTLYLAEYGDNGQLSSAKLGENQIVDGKLTITSDLPATDNYKFILWDIDQCPLIDAIANIY